MLRTAKPLDFSFEEVKDVAELLNRPQFGGSGEATAAPTAEVSGGLDSAAPAAGAGGGVGGAGGVAATTAAPTDDGAEAARPKSAATAIRLNNNDLASVANVHRVLSTVLVDVTKLTWIDLSFNNITVIGSAFSKLPSLKRLYLHSNKVQKLSEVEQLQANRSLEALTLHGCPVQDRKNYRVFVVSTLPWLRNLDFSGVTKRELDAAVSWRKMTKIVRRPKPVDDDE